MPSGSSAYFAERLIIRIMSISPVTVHSVNRKPKKERMIVPRMKYVAIAKRGNKIHQIVLL